MVKILIQVLPKIGILARQISFTDKEQCIKLAIVFILRLHNNNLGVESAQRREV
jgi:hypothetical protein